MEKTDRYPRGGKWEDGGNKGEEGKKKKKTVDSILGILLLSFRLLILENISCHIMRHPCEETLA